MIWECCSRSTVSTLKGSSRIHLPRGMYFVTRPWEVPVTNRL